MSRRRALKRRKNSSAKLVHNKFGIRLAHHSHSGRHLPVHYTSYAILFFLLVFTALMLVFTSHSARAVDIVDQGSIGLSGFSKGPPPDQPAVFTYPAQDSRFTDYDNIIPLRGTCEAGLFLEIYRNDVFAGGTICRSDNTFEIIITIVPGRNLIHARIHDALLQYGPVSETLRLWFDIPHPKIPPLLIYTPPIQKGILKGQKFNLVFDVSGGTLPYGVSIDWGDSSVADVIVRNKPGKTDYSHKYKNNGQYTITISATDTNGLKAVIQSTLVVHGSEQFSSTSSICNTGTSSDLSINCTFSNNLLGLIDRAWPALIVAFLMALSFWIGEKVVFNAKSRPRLKIP